MRIRIDVLHGIDAVQRRLLKDGWKVERDAGGSLRASHPRADSERSARLRLCQLGLLTSGSLRIEFPLLT